MRLVFNVLVPLLAGGTDVKGEKKGEIVMTYEYEIRALNYSGLRYPRYSMGRIGSYLDEITGTSLPPFQLVEASEVYLYSRSSAPWTNLITNMKEQARNSSLLVFYVKETATAGKQKTVKGWTFYDDEMWTMSPLSSFKELENDESAAPQWIRELMTEQKLKSTEAILQEEKLMRAIDSEYTIRVLNLTEEGEERKKLMRNICTNLNIIISESPNYYPTFDCDTLFPAIFYSCAINGIWYDLLPNMKDLSQNFSGLVFYVEEKTTHDTNGYVFHHGNFWIRGVADPFDQLSGETIGTGLPPAWIQELMISYKKDRSDT